LFEAGWILGWLPIVDQTASGGQFVDKQSCPIDAAQRTMRGKRVRRRERQVLEVAIPGWISGSLRRYHQVSDSLVLRSSLGPLSLCIFDRHIFQAPVELYVKIELSLVRPEEFVHRVAQGIRRAGIQTVVP
jgi:hypothetical protein